MNIKKTVLVTGALGQDGKILSKILLKKRYKVIGLVNKFKKKRIKKVIYHKLSLKNYISIKKIIRKTKPSHIVHFGSKNPSFKQVKGFYKDNLISTKNIIKAIIETNKNTIFIFPNSSQIFLKKRLVNENDKFKISNTYTKFRINIYKYLMNLKKIEKFKFCNLILFNHDSSLRDKRFLLPRIVKYVNSGNTKLLKKIYKENIIGDFSHSEEICMAIYMIIKKKLCIDKLILSSGKKIKINDIINYLIKKYSNLKKIQTFVKKNNNFIVGNNNKAKKILNWKIKKNIYTAVDEMMNFYDKNK